MKKAILVVFTFYLCLSLHLSNAINGHSEKITFDSGTIVELTPLLTDERGLLTIVLDDGERYYLGAEIKLVSLNSEAVDIHAIKIECIISLTIGINGTIEFPEDEELTEIGQYRMTSIPIDYSADWGLFNISMRFSCKEDIRDGIIEPTLQSDWLFSLIITVEETDTQTTPAFSIITTLSVLTSFALTYKKESYQILKKI